MPSEDSKPVKKQDDNDKISTLKKAAKPNGKPLSKGSKLKKLFKEEPEPIPRATSASRSKVKRELKDDDDDSDEDDDDKPISKKISKTKVVKEEVKKKKKVKKEEEVVVTETKVKKVKKVYDLPGQKRDPPAERDPSRVFYETLHEQIPTSEMAQIWLMESGLLPKEVAKKVFEKKQKKALQQKVSSPVKSVTAVKKSTKSVTIKKESPATPNSSVKKKPTNSTSKQTNSTSKPTKKHKSENSSSEDDDSDFDIGSATKKKRKVA